MNLTQAIYKRQSVRSYKMSSLSTEQMQAVRQAIAAAKPLYPHIPTTIDIIEDGLALSGKSIISGYGNVKSPHYLAAASGTGDGHLENAGFILEQAVLAMTEMGIGTCWVGTFTGSRIKGLLPTPLPAGQKGIIAIAFGEPADMGELEPKALSKRKRIPLEEMVIAEEPLSDRAREIYELVLAHPSAVNAQKTRFFHKRKEAAVYMGSTLYKNINRIDAGIALAHLDLACQERGIGCAIAPHEAGAPPKRMTYIAHARFDEEL